MAAFTGTPVGSVQYNLQTALVQEKMNPVDNAGMRIAFFNYTHTATEGSGTGEINLVKLPAGRIRVYSDLSRLVTTQFAASADIHIGFRAYTDESDGTTVSEDDNAFEDNGDAGGGALDQAFTLPAAGYKDFDSTEGVIIYAMVDTGNIEAADTIHGWIVYSGGTAN